MSSDKPQTMEAGMCFHYSGSSPLPSIPQAICILPSFSASWESLFLTACSVILEKSIPSGSFSVHFLFGQWGGEEKIMLMVTVTTMMMMMTSS